MLQIREHFEKIVAVPDEEWELFSSRLTRLHVPKKTLLLKVGQTEKYLSFIEKGIVRFFIPKEENDLTFAFAFSGAFVSAYDSFLTQTASGYHVQTLTETILWRVKFNELQDIYKETKVGNMIGRYASEDLFLKKARRELSLLNDTAEERYLNLFTEQLHMVKYIPLKYLASYIGITPQALSRIRRRIS